MTYVGRKLTLPIAIVAGLAAIVAAATLAVQLSSHEQNTDSTPTTSAAVSPPAPTHQTTAPQPPSSGALQPGPHSPLADVALPADIVMVGNSSSQEVWRYTARYDDVVAFFRSQFATGRRYDPHGATWWRDLPPCYRDGFDRRAGTPSHQSPPHGWVKEDSTQWLWADERISLSVAVFRPTSQTAPSEIVISYARRDNSLICNRS